MRKNNDIDPHFARESQNYDRPIPSREFIMTLLAERGEPLQWQQIAQLLDLHAPQDLEALTRRLKAMERDGQLIRNRKNGYGLLSKMDLVAGTVIAHPDGYGFLVPDDGTDDLYLSAKQMRQIIHGDAVVARESGRDRRGRREGSVVEVLQRNTHEVVGRFQNAGGVAYVVPDNNRITHNILIPSENQRGALDGQIVVARLLAQPSKRHPAVGKITEVLGEHLAPGMEIDVAIRTHAIPYLWDQEALHSVDLLGDAVNESDKRGRIDIRSLPLVTIDGSDAKDFDDAVYCEALPGKGKNKPAWRLLVAIADVSHYVKAHTALDRAALERATSVYFPGRVVPMLPEPLSNGLCSLMPNVDRLCMVCDMRINSQGTILSYEFYEAVMHSHARLTYEDVAAWLQGEDTLGGKLDKSVMPNLRNLNELYKALQMRRNQRGAIEFETNETVIQFGADQKIQQVVPLVRNDAHRIIEECMISANICAANFLQQQSIPALFRNHEKPSEEKLADLRAFLKPMGLQLHGGEEPEARHYAKLLQDAAGRVDFNLIQTVMLRSLKQALYEPQCEGHFGLALEEYAHFTSPIRRYPDLLVHRAIRHCISGKKISKFAHTEDEMITLGEHCSMCERRADDATREVVSWLKCEYMMDKVGEVFEGIITGVTSFGLFVELQPIYVEGLVHVTALHNDYYHYDEIKHCLVGERSACLYRLGDALQVKVVRVDLNEKKIDFELASGSQVKVNSSSEKRLKKSKRMSGSTTETQKSKKRAIQEGGSAEQKKPKNKRKKRAASAKQRISTASKKKSTKHSSAQTSKSKKKLKKTVTKKKKHAKKRRLKTKP